MKIILAIFFKALFKLNFFKRRYFGIHKRLFKPFNLFGGVNRIVKTKNGIIMSLHIDDFIQEHLYFLGEYEMAELKSIEQFLSEDSVFIDIGANIGLFSLHATKFVSKNGQIISFEPFPRNFNSLTTNIKLNHFSNVQLEQIAIGEVEGSITLHYDEKEKNLGMVSTTPFGKSIKEEVKMTSLDSYLNQNPKPKVDLIKIDIEGFEYPALLGMKDTLTTFYPTLLIEILNDDKQLNQNKKCEELLKTLGYNKYFIDDYGSLSENEVNIDRMNYVFTTQPPFLS